MTPRNHPDMLLDLHPASALGPDTEQGDEQGESPHLETTSEEAGLSATSGPDLAPEDPGPAPLVKPHRKTMSLGAGNIAARLFPSRSAPTSDPSPVELWTRAPRPTAVRLRRTLAVGAVLGAASILAGSLAWAFVVRPEMRAGAFAREKPQKLDDRTAKPPRSLSERPARYDQLPQPRTWPEDPSAASPEAGPDMFQGTTPSTPPSTPASQAAPQYSAWRQSPDAPRSPADRNGEPTLEARAHSSELFFTGANDDPQGTHRPLVSPATGDASGPSMGLPPGRGIYNPARLTRPLSPFEVKAGSIIQAALLTSIDTSRRGSAAAVVTRNVHDTISGQHLLVPQGSRLIGRYDGDSAYGDRKAFVVWERLILPDGRSLVLDEEPGVDATGALGVQGRLDRRLLPLALAVLAGGAVTAIGEAARNSDGNQGLLGDAGDAAALEAARTGSRLIDRELQVRPVIKLSPGSSVGVLITRDLVLEPWRR